MELFFLLLLIVLMAGALASGFPVAFALPGSAILTISIAALCGYVFEGSPDVYFAQGGATNWLSAGVTNFRGVYWEVERDTLIAIPLFVFMGIMLQRSKIAEDLLITMAQLFGPVRGGLGISVVFVGALLAATTGIVGATVVAMGLISLPAMMRNKYANWLSTGTIAASGTLGQIIPPSIVLIILADQLSNAVDQAGSSRTAMYKAATGEFSMPSDFGVVSTSAGDMFMGAMVPGLVLVAVYMVFILVVAFLKKDIAPPVPFEGKYDRAFLAKILLALVPPLTLIFVVLGSIIAGIATVNQAGAVGAVGATVMAGYRLYDGKPRAYWPAILATLSIAATLVITSTFHVNVKAIHSTNDVIGVTLAVITCALFLFAVAWSGWRTLKIDRTMQGVLIETAKTTSLVFIILLGAAMLTAAFRGFGGEELVKQFLEGLPGGFWMQFIIVMGVIFILGFFLDFIEIAVVVVPIVAPILLADPSANVTAVWLGVMIGLNIQTSFLTPPFGFALFYLRGVAPPVVRTIQMYKGVIPFISLQLLALLIVGMNPQLVNYLPTRMSLLSETAPPPANPRLQICIENYVEEQFAANGDSLRAAIDAARGWDMSGLPKPMQRDISKALDLASQSFGALADARATTAAIDEAAVDYRPILTETRRIEADIALHDKHIEEAQQEFDRAKRMEGDEAAERAARLTETLARLKAEREALLAAAPENWEAAHKEFAKLLSAEKKAYLGYRRTVDSAYEPIAVAIRTLKGGEELQALQETVAGLAGTIREKTPEEVEDAFKDVESMVGDVEGAGDIRTALSKARRAMRVTSSNPADPETALQEHANAMELLKADIEWRTEAASSLLAQMEAYEEAIRSTIGLRQQQRLPREVALYVASCNSGHRDISLYF
ncbi:TRAP transporter large permease subunit [Rhodospirillaceae bacterium KN72]|uniref:TRAP transporter large permease subunit n=1 Tax=Pacificispira spongiicola TaxID=2729598 RepID=A0A7Y0HG49_9PROT|nr:TRAP transporter large permease subunit [Pacificispira spongiicola]NMM43989.1 TRAP transporter large permease subunit [Pacificispira spongiicola]